MKRGPLFSESIARREKRKIPSRKLCFSIALFAILLKTPLVRTVTLIRFEILKKTSHIKEDKPLCSDCEQLATVEL